MRGIKILFSATALVLALHVSGAPAQVATNANPTSPTIQEIVKMVDAGISKEVIRAYIEQSPPYSPSADDIIALKTRGVTDDITTVLLKHGLEARAQAGPRTDAPALNPPPSAPAVTYMDPEGYDFWWYHYAYPRTLAYAYDRLYPYNYGVPYSYGFYPDTFAGGVPFGFGQPGFGAFPHRSGSILHNRALNTRSPLGARSMRPPR